jgi:hypothetical protein
VVVTSGAVSRHQMIFSTPGYETAGTRALPLSLIGGLTVLEMSPCLVTRRFYLTSP